MIVDNGDIYGSTYGSDVALAEGELRVDGVEAIGHGCPRVRGGSRRAAPEVSEGRTAAAAAEGGRGSGAPIALLLEGEADALVEGRRESVVEESGLVGSSID
jgi:hypothetical protein